MIVVSKESAGPSALDGFARGRPGPSPLLTGMNVCRRHSSVLPSSVHTEALPGALPGLYLGHRL